MYQFHWLLIVSGHIWPHSKYACARCVVRTCVRALVCNTYIIVIIVTQYFLSIQTAASRNLILYLATSWFYLLIETGFIVDVLSKTIFCVILILSSFLTRHWDCWRNLANRPGYYNWALPLLIHVACLKNQSRNKLEDYMASAWLCHMVYIVV